MKKRGVSPIYLVTDHTGFYEKYGWEFYCMAQGDDEPEMTRLYIHKQCIESAGLGIGALIDYIGALKW